MFILLTVFLIVPEAEKFRGLLFLTKSEADKKRSKKIRRYKVDF